MEQTEMLPALTESLPPVRIDIGFQPDHARHHHCLVGR